MTSSADVQFFRNIQDSSDRNVWLDYLETFPDGEFRKIALQRVQDLTLAPGAADRIPHPPGRHDKHSGVGPTARGFMMAGALAGAVFGIVEFSSSIGSGVQALTTRFREATDPDFDPAADLERRTSALIAAAFSMSGVAYSDDEAEAAIDAALNLTSDEIEANEQYLSAMEEIVDSFLSSERFDYAALLEEKHLALFQTDQRFFQSFVQSYGIMLIESPIRVSDDLWSVEDQEMFDDYLSRYRKYATLDVVRKHWPEYDALYGAIIARFAGGGDEQMVAHMRKVGGLDEQDLNSFQRLGSAIAGQSYKRSKSQESELASARILDLISQYGRLDQSGNWLAIAQAVGAVELGASDAVLSAGQ